MFTLCVGRRDNTSRKLNKEGLEFHTSVGSLAFNRVSLVVDEQLKPYFLLSFLPSYFSISREYSERGEKNGGNKITDADLQTDS